MSKEFLDGYQIGWDNGVYQTIRTLLKNEYLDEDYVVSMILDNNDMDNHEQAPKDWRKENK